MSVVVLGGGSLAADRLAGAIVSPIPAAQVTHPSNFAERRTTLEFSYEFRTNSLGLRYRELAVERPGQHDVRVAVTGDSFTEGYGVADGDRFSDRLERRFSSAGRPVSFINTGLSGAGPVQYGRSLLAVGLRYDPDLAVVVVHGNDVHDMAPDGRLDVRREPSGRFLVNAPPLYWPPGNTAARMAYAFWPWTYARLQHFSRTLDDRELRGGGFLHLVRTRAARLGITDAEVDRWAARIPHEWLDAAETERLNGSLLAHGLFVPGILEEALDLAGPQAEAKWAAFTSVLGELTAHLRSAGVPAAVVYSPVAAQHDASVTELYRIVGVRLRPEWLTRQSEFERRLEEWAGRTAVPYLSLTEPFRAESRRRPGKLNYALDSHWTGAGHELAAQVIGNWLVTEHLLGGP